MKHRKSGTTLKYAYILAEEQGGWFCIYCGCELSPNRPGGNRKRGYAEVDHLVPISKGGTDDLSNLALACVTCNTQKKAMTAHDFVLWRRDWLARKEILKRIFNEY